MDKFCPGMWGYASGLNVYLFILSYHFLIIKAYLVKLYTLERVFLYMYMSSLIQLHSCPVQDGTAQSRVVILAENKSDMIEIMNLKSIWIVIYSIFDYI